MLAFLFITEIFLIYQRYYRKPYVHILMYLDTLHKGRGCTFGIVTSSLQELCVEMFDTIHTRQKQRNVTECDENDKLSHMGNMISFHKCIPEPFYRDYDANYILKSAFIRQCVTLDNEYKIYSQGKKDMNELCATCLFSERATYNLRLSDNQSLQSTIGL